MKITETGASNAPPPTRGGATEQRAGSSFDQLLALHHQARTAAAEGPKSKSERHDRGVRAHGEPQRAHDARDARRAAHDDRKAAAGGAKGERAPDAPAPPDAAAEVPAAEVPAAEVPAAEASATVARAAAVVTEPVAAPVLPAASVTAVTTSAEGDDEVHAPQQAVLAAPVIVAAAEGEHTGTTTVAPLPPSAPVTDPSVEAPAGLPVAVTTGPTDTPEAAKTATPEAPAQSAAPRAPVPDDVQPSPEQAPASADGEQPATTASTAPVPTGREAAAPVAGDRARAVAAPNAAVHDAPVTPVEAAPAPVTSPAAALRGPQAAPGLQLAATVERLHDLVQVASRNGAAHARLQLHPAEFGGIEVRLRSSANGVTAKITADRPEAVQALQQAAAELRQSLQERGLTVLDVEVSLASAAGSGAHDAAAQAGGSQSDLDPENTSDDRRGMDAAPDTNDLDEPDLGDAPRGDAGAVLVDVLA